MNFCIEIINKLRRELPLLRREKSELEKRKEKLENELTFWREKYKNERVKNNILRKEKGRLKKETDNLKEEIDRLTKTNYRYRASLFEHGNFKHPYGKANKKDKGGQTGHPSTNRESHEDYSSFEPKRVYAKTCARCGYKLKRVPSFRPKVLIDIKIQPEVIKMIFQSERQWCGHCKMEVNARDSRSLPFTEYGINIFMMTLILRFKCHSSFQNISAVMSIAYGLKLSKSDIFKILKQAKFYLKSKYDELIKSIRKNRVIYSDETGWLVNGQPAWMWIMASEDETVYFAAEGRGKGVAEELYGGSRAYSMHDGLASYSSVAPTDKQCFCWAHFLRFAFEETVNKKEKSEAVLLCDELVRIYQLKKIIPNISGRSLRISSISDLIRY